MNTLANPELPGRNGRVSSWTICSATATRPEQQGHQRPGLPGRLVAGLDPLQHQRLRHRADHDEREDHRAHRHRRLRGSRSRATCRWSSANGGRSRRTRTSRRGRTARPWPAGKPVQVAFERGLVVEPGFLSRPVEPARLCGCLGHGYASTPAPAVRVRALTTPDGRVQVGDGRCVLDAVLIRAGEHHGDVLEVLRRRRRGDLPFQTAGRSTGCRPRVHPGEQRRPDEVDQEDQDRGAQA